MNIKIELSSDMIARIDMARRLEDPVPPRTAMIRRLLDIGLGANTSAKMAATGQPKRLLTLEKTLARYLKPS